MNTFPSFLLRAIGLALFPAAYLINFTGSSTPTFFAALAALILGTVLLIVAEHLGNRTRAADALQPVFHTIDAVYFLVSLPFIFTVFHEYVLCPLFPSLGFHGADSPTACTIGWGIFALLYIIPSWLLITLCVVPFRLRTLLGQGKPARLMTRLYVVACGIPLAMLAYVLFRILV